MIQSTGWIQPSCPFAQTIQINILSVILGSITFSLIGITVNPLPHDKILD